MFQYFLILIIYLPSAIFILDFSIFLTLVSCVFLAFFYLTPDRNNYFLIQLMCLGALLFYAVLFDFYDIGIFLPGKTDDFRFYYAYDFTFDQTQRYSYFLIFLQSVISIEESLVPFSSMEGLRIVSPILIPLNVYAINLLQRIFKEQSLLTLIVSAAIVLNPYVMVQSFFNLRDPLITIISFIVLMRTISNGLRILDYFFILAIYILRPLSGLVVLALISFNFFFHRRITNPFLLVTPVLVTLILFNVFYSTLGGYFYFLSDLSLVEDKASENVAGGFGNFFDFFYFVLTSLYRIFVHPTNFEADPVTSLMSMMGIIYLFVFVLIIPILLTRKNGDTFFNDSKSLTLFLTYAIGGGILSVITANLRHYLLSKYFVMLFFIALMVVIYKNLRTTGHSYEK